MSLGAIKRRIAPLLVHLASRSLQRAAARCSSPRQWVDLVFRRSWGRFHIAPLQIREEITGLLEILREEPPRRVLEIGTATGGTLFLLTRVAHPEAVLVSVDLPWGSGGGYPPWREQLYGRFVRPDQRVCLVQRNSHQPAALEAVQEALEAQPVDFLLIDGDHSYEGAKQDWEMYRPLVRTDGLIAFHDIAPGSHKLVGGVPELWRELREEHDHHELVADWDQGGCGLGLIWNR